MQTQTDDIIIQTYQDPTGDLDSTGTSVSIPVRKLSPQRLDSLKVGLTFLRQRGM
ncbi:hypothetical protein [Mucilaginibacter pedocola]|uniref:hypothetical protein n=1 Tax=Mucilaginibacter pedocola TaxID=1792845 RepID=UPI0012DF6E1A|nr:hypothetical protein [Mucilaginibacter pedocola]